MGISKAEEKSESTTNNIRSIFVVLNPVAGLTDAVAARETIAAFCKEKGWKCEIHETSPDEDLRQLVRDEIKQGYDIIVAAGGDGTVSAVVSGMINSGVPMGILPAGTGNALARELGIPLAIADALDVLGNNPTVRTLDGMELLGDYYVLNASVGLSSMTMKNTGRQEKRRFGMLAYAYRAVGLVFRSDSHRFELVANNRIYRFKASEVMVTNTKFLGMEPQLNGVKIDPNDHRLDLYIVRARRPRDIANVMVNFVRPRNLSEERNLRYLAITDEVEIRSEFPLPVQADGEVVGNTPVRIRLIRDALKVYVPSNSKEEQNNH